jgi:diphthine-ammonia ligase
MACARTWRSYTKEYIRLVGEASAMGITHIIFGDILGDAHRAWDEGVCAVHHLAAVLPLWGESTRTVATEFIATGSTAIIVTARAAYLDATWLGRSIDVETIEELEIRGLDPCGEFGEYHTVVTGTPLFSAPLALTLGAREMHSDCWALDVTLPSPAESSLTLTNDAAG